MTTTERLFFAIARAEGLSLLALFFVAMPLKYGAGMPLATTWTGWAHGVLFVAYVVALAAAAFQARWSLGRTALGFVCASVPFGTFWFERQVGAKPAAG